jgi:Ig-like domain from next to BRCA1 gene
MNSRRFDAARFRVYFGLFVCFEMLAAGSRALAGDNAAVLSVSITNGTSVVPRSFFTQTWTFTNTGTTTWTPGRNGYTLDMIGLDSLGCIPLITNTNAAAPTYHFPRAAINSGNNVAPGQTASYSLNFIAPEAAGSYTDSFQLNGNSFFGPVATVQVTVPNTGNTNLFDRARAISFANNYAAYYCPDGYFWINGSDYTTTNVDSFIGVPMNVSGEGGGIGDDCAHYVSYCIGNGPYIRGGGLNVPSRAKPTYGEPGAGDVIYNILLTPGYGVEVSSLSQLEPGDVIGWNWEGETNAGSSYIDHVTLYMGNGMVSCHAESILDVTPSFFGTGPVTAPNTGWSWHLIHILDYPTLWTSRSGKNMTFMWTTNWNKFALYSATSLNGTWTKNNTPPTVNSITNKITLTLPASGNIYYRLEMP